MGTRNLICVVKDGSFKVAQYSQWDGYPSGQGIRILQFLQAGTSNTDGPIPTTTLDLERFKKKVATCFWGTEEQLDAAWKEGIGKGEKNAYLSRDTGAGILDYVYKAEEPVMLSDMSGFAADSLFCEYAYVTDLDQNTFEVYKGFQKSPVPSEQRFASLPIPPRPNGKPNEYFHVRLVQTYSLDNLPTREQFIKDLTPEDESDVT